MKRYSRSKLFKVSATVIGALAATWAVAAVRDVYRVTRLTDKMTTVCVGRMLIELPEEAQVELYGARISSFDIDAFTESQETFDARVAAREAEIRATPDRLGGPKNMEMIRELKTANGLTGKIFVHGRNVSEGTESDAFTLKRYRYEGIALEAHVHGSGISIDMTNKDYDPDRMENLPRLVSQLVPNPTNSIPTEPGFCIDRAYFRDPLTAGQREQATVAVKLPSLPDIGINFDTIAGTKPDPQGLLERNAAARARLPGVLNLRVTNLRAAPRTIGGLAGEELGQTVVEENFVIVHGFQWEVIGTEDNVLVPNLTLLMATGRGKGGPVQSSLSQPAALALWDRISSSIRLRPVAQ